MSGETLKMSETIPLLTQTIKQGDLEKVKALLEDVLKKLEVKQRQKILNDLLFSGVDNADITEYLLSEGSEHGYKNSDGKTALHLACESGTPDSVDTLIDHGASMAISDTLGYQPIHYAVERNHHDLLLHLKVKIPSEITRLINSKTKEEQTPLLLACENGQLEIIEFLLKYTTNPLSADREGKTVLHQLAFYAQPEALQYVLNNILKRKVTSEIDKKNLLDKTALHLAAENTNLECMDLLLKHGANFTVKDRNGFNPFHLVVFHGSVDGVKELYELWPELCKESLNQAVDKGAVCHAASCNKVTQVPSSTPLHLAVLKSDDQMVKFLLDKGADCYLPDEEGRTPQNLAHILNKEVIPEYKHKLQAVTDMLVKWHQLHNKDPTLLEFGKVDTINKKDRPKQQIVDSLNKVHEKLNYTQEELLGKFSQLNQEVKRLNSEIKKLRRQVSEEKAYKKKLLDKIKELSIKVVNKSNEAIQTLQKSTLDMEKGIRIIKENVQFNKYGEVEPVKDYDDHVYYRIFTSIAKLAGKRKDMWKKLAKKLFENYPSTFKEKILADMKKRHTSEEDSAYEALARWKVYAAHLKPKEKLEFIEKVSKGLDINEAVHIIQAEIEKPSLHAGIMPKIGDPLSTKSLQSLANKLGREWKSLASNLGLSKANIDQVQNDNKGSNIQYVILCMLEKWKEMTSGDDVTKTGVLIEALQQIERVDIAKSICS